MFNGFNKKTVSVLDSLKFNNSKSYYNNIKEEYAENITKPLKLLNEELIGVLGEIDGDLILNTRYCISSPFSDARFNKSRPLKEYVYLRYRVNPQKSCNVLGYFFDASPEEMKYGLKVYKASHRGICDIGDLLLWENTELLNALEGRGYSLAMGGASEHEERFEKINLEKEWVSRNEFMLYKRSKIEDVFFKRELFEKIKWDFFELSDVYFILKEALI